MGEHLSKSIYPLISVLLCSISVFAVTEAVNDLAARVDRLVRSVETRSPGGTAEQQRVEYLTLRRQFEILNDETDLLEDKYERENLSSRISWEEFIAIKRN